MELAAIADKPIVYKKAAAYADVVKNLNDARERGLPYKPCYCIQECLRKSWPGLFWWQISSYVQNLASNSDIDG